jgi:hypothetical protein
VAFTCNGSLGVQQPNGLTTVTVRLVEGEPEGEILDTAPVTRNNELVQRIGPKRGCRRSASIGIDSHDQRGAARIDREHKHIAQIDASIRNSGRTIEMV